MNILITGISRGIGFQLTKLALEAGHKIYGVARAETPSVGLQNLKEQYGSLLQILKIDLKEVEASAKIANELGSLDKLDLVINNAGVFREKDGLSDFQESFHINAVAPYFLTLAVVPYLKKSSSPKLVNITSRMGSIADNTSGGYYSYRASKAALNMLNKSLTIDHPWLTTLVLHPGWVKTDMGGEQAPLSPEESASGLWSVISKASRENSGRFMSYNGEPIPW